MNKIEINIPEGFEIDNQKSDFSKGIIEFKPVEKKKLSYEDVANELFSGKKTYFLMGNGKIGEICFRSTTALYDPNNATSKEQLECLTAYNKLRNVAVYLNKHESSWKSSDLHYYFQFRYDVNLLCIRSTQCAKTSDIYFNTKDLAEQALEILGEEEIKKALFIY